MTGKQWVLNHLILEEFMKVINASADFNKVVLILVKK
jgi:hypothetical protein